MFINLSSRRSGGYNVSHIDISLTFGHSWGPFLVLILPAIMSLPPPPPPSSWQHSQQFYNMNYGRLSRIINMCLWMNSGDYDIFHLLCCHLCCVKLPSQRATLSLQFSIINNYFLWLFFLMSTQSVWPPSTWTMFSLITEIKKMKNIRKLLTEHDDDWWWL